MLVELVQLAVGNLARARARLVMTVGGVLVGTTAVILLVAITFGLQQAAEAGLGSNSALTEIQVYPNFDRQGTNENTPQLDAETVQALWRIPGVDVVIPMIFLQGGELRSGDYVGYSQIMGINPELLPYLGVRAERGELTLASGQVIAGALVGDYFFDPESESDQFEPVKVDFMMDPVELRLIQSNSPAQNDRTLPLNITAQLTQGSSYDYTLLMPIEDVIRHNEWMTGQTIDLDNFRFDQIIVRASSRETTKTVSEAIRDMGLSAGGIGDFLDQLNAFFVTMRLMLGGIGGVALLVAAFGVANTMTMAILERTREIGLMKAIGATDRDVLTIFLLEAALVGFIGGSAGVALSLVLQNAINQAVLNAPTQQGGGIMFLPFDPAQIGGDLVVIPTELSLFAVVLATLVGMGAGLFPALRASRMPPVMALKQE